MLRMPSLSRFIPDAVQVGLALGAAGAALECGSRATALLNPSRSKTTAPHNLLNKNIKPFLGTTAGQILQNTAFLIPTVVYSAKWLWKAEGPLPIKIVHGLGTAILVSVVGALAITPLVRILMKPEEEETGVQQLVLVNIVSSVFKVGNAAGLVIAGIKGRVNTPQGAAYAVSLMLAALMQNLHYAVAIYRK